MFTQVGKLWHLFFPLAAMAMFSDPAHGSERNLRSGEQAKVTIGQAPVTDDLDQEIIRLTAGTMVMVKEIEALRVKVEFTVEGQKKQGWVPTLYLRQTRDEISPKSQEAARPPKKPPEAPMPAQPQRTAQPLDAAACDALTQVFKRMVCDVVLQKAKPGTLGISEKLQPYTLMKTESAGGSAIEAWLVFGPCEVTMVSGYDRMQPLVDPRKLRVSYFAGKWCTLFFPVECKVGSHRIEARSLVRVFGPFETKGVEIVGLKDPPLSWEKDTTPSALDDLAGEVLNAVLKGNSAAASLLPCLGESAMNRVPVLIKALPDRRKSAAALGALRQITGQEFGAKPGEWRKWWEEQERGQKGTTESSKKD